jgi:hypothetical protein
MRRLIFDPEIGISFVMRHHLELDSEEDILDGALVYRIQRRHAASDEPIQDESKSIQLLVTWRFEHTKGLHVRALLVEHDKELGWDKDKLKRLHQKCWHSLDAQVNSIRSNWLLDDTTVLMITVKTMNGGHRWDILISEGMRDHIGRPLLIDVKR